MNTLKTLMLEFAILGATPNISDVGLGFEDGEASPYPEEPETEEYELDADGNPILDDYGNPVKKAVNAEDEAAPACACNLDAPEAQGDDTLAIAPPEEAPQDEFTFR